MRLGKKYALEKNVLEAAQERISFIFDHFESIVVSISGGKDSEVAAHLCLTEARKRGRKIGLFYLDEEVVYRSTIEMVAYIMDLYPENTIRYWLQIPFNLTNSTSMTEGQLHAWDSSKRKLWMHKRKHNNILHKTWSHETKIADKNKGFGFYDVLRNFQMGFSDTAFVVGLRANESLDRYRAVTKHPGYQDVMWSTKQKRGCCNFYPLYDWMETDIWKYIANNGLKYHKYYDYCFKKGVPIHYMRVSSLTHEKAFKSIQDLPEFEFDTYEKLLKRIKGISFAQETARNKKMFRVTELPKRYETWKEYRDNLLLTYPVPEHKAIFEKRFAKHLDNEWVYKQQCKQLVLGDIENNFPIKNENKEDLIKERIDYWRKML